jgi:integrase
MTTSFAPKRAILMILLQCGLRESELIKLTLADVDLEKRERELHLRNRKGGVDTDIPLPTPAVEAVSQWLSVRPATELEHVFLSKTGKPLDERSSRYLVKYYMRKAGIKKQASRIRFVIHSAHLSLQKMLI